MKTNFSCIISFILVGLVDFQKSTCNISMELRRKKGKDDFRAEDFFSSPV